jgi:hypothetical protein
MQVMPTEKYLCKRPHTHNAHPRWWAIFDVEVLISKLRSG